MRAWFKVPSLSKKIQLFFFNSRNNYHFVGFDFNFGWDTNKCQITTCIDSEMGVTNLASLDFIKIEQSEFLNANPSFFPTIDKILQPIFLPYLIALIKFVETFFLIFPPPTEKIKIKSFLLSFDIFRYSSKIVSKPSSLVLAVISDGLSVHKFQYYITF